MYVHRLVLLVESELSSRIARHYSIACIDNLPRRIYIAPTENRSRPRAQGPNSN